MAKLCLIGDVHGKLDQYLNICRSAENMGLQTLQVGDLSMSEYGYKYLLLHLNPNKHRFIGGNHDYYPDLSALHLCDWGYVDWGYKIFVVRGAYSINHEHKKRNGTWYEDEELSTESLNQAIQIYEAFKPNLVITHDCP